MDPPTETSPHARPGRSLPVAVRRFLDTEAASGIVLVTAAVVAVVWANSPWQESYESVWHTTVTVKVGTVGVSEDLQHFVNDGLMSLFFLVVALEIKRELVVGDLRDPRLAALPAVAAAGGMVVPAAIYVAFNAGGEGVGGWGIPVATDIAFAVGVLALLGSRVPSSLKLFLLSLAIVDDIGGIAVIALVYTDRIDAGALALALAAIAAAGLLRWVRIWWPPAFVALGVLCWLATYNSGLHATLAGVAFGLLAPAKPVASADVARRWAYDLSDEPSAAELREMTTIAKDTVSVAERVQHVLHPLVSFAVVPIFALANAGVRVTGDALTKPGAASVALGVFFGLTAGKLVGITSASALAVRLRLAKLPDDVTWPHIAGAATVAGIGFTVSLFITGLAFDSQHLQNAARLAVLAASIAAALAGTAVLFRAGRPGEVAAGTDPTAPGSDE